MIHTWDDRKADGDKYEAEQDAHWSQHYRIESVGKATDRRGVDRIFHALKAPIMRFTMQYKGDRKAHETGNLFLEILSNVEHGTAGGALKCDADTMSIYVPAERTFYWCSVPMLRVLLRVWVMQYPTGLAHNKGYDTKGILVPREVVEFSFACLATWHNVAVMPLEQLEGSATALYAFRRP